jgi:hypothetical protein
VVAWLIKNGIPFEVAHNLPPEEILAYSVCFAQFENGGLEYDWGRGKFVER